ncbi:MAG: GxxExxY protein [Spirochaetales bacterium]|nr:GxxExxY protein [Spirochaetales bacterium]
MTKLIYKELSDLIIRMAFAIHSHFGPGLLESVYESAFCVELSRAAVPFERQKIYSLNYKNEYVGAYIADLVVDNTIILELKAVSQLSKVMEAQILSYLKLSGLPVGYLINFNTYSLEWKRFVNQLS